MIESGHTLIGVEKRMFLYDGPVMVSTGQRVTEWTARESTDVISENKVNATNVSYALAA